MNLLTFHLYFYPNIWQTQVPQPYSIMDGSRGGYRGSGPPPEKSQNLGLFAMQVLVPWKKQTFIVGLSSARQRNDIKMAFRWQADDGPFIVIFGSSISSLTKIMGPLWQKFLDPRMSIHWNLVLREMDAYAIVLREMDAFASCVIKMSWKGWPFGSLAFDVFLCFITFLYGASGQVWYLIISTLDLCLLSYFEGEFHYFV